MDEVEVLLREVVMVPGDELQGVMEGRPWHTFYTRVRQGGIAGLSYNRVGTCYASLYLDVDNCIHLSHAMRLARGNGNKT